MEKRKKEEETNCSVKIGETPISGFRNLPRSEDDSDNAERSNRTTDQLRRTHRNTSQNNMTHSYQSADDDDDVLELLID